MTDAKLLPKVAPAELSYTGKIDYTIEFNADNVGIKIHNPSAQNSAACFSMVADHLARMLVNIKDNQKLTKHEKVAIKQAEWIITRITNAQIGAAYGEIKHSSLHPTIEVDAKA